MSIFESNAFGKPILAGILLMLAALVFRLVDIFVLRLDERLGEIILSKTLGFGLVALFVWAIGKKLSNIGFHNRRLGESLLIGAVITVLAFIVAYTVEMVVLRQSGQAPRLLVAAIDPKAGVAGGFLFGLFLMAGNLVNSFAEEGIFRGVMLNLFPLKLSAIQSNWLQAVLFGAWHLVWVIKWYQTGQVHTPGEVGFAVVANFLPQLCLGLVWGFLYLKTDSLWAAWIAHTLTNTTLNLLHTSTAEGMNQGMSIRMTVFCVVSLLLMLLVRYLNRQWKMPEMTPFGN